MYKFNKDTYFAYNSKCSKLGMTRANDIKEKKKKTSGFILLEASQSKVGAESHRLYGSSRQAMSVWKYRYIPEMTGKPPMKNVLH